MEVTGMNRVVYRPSGEGSGELTLPDLAATPVFIVGVEITTRPAWLAGMEPGTDVIIYVKPLEAQASREPAPANREGKGDWGLTPLEEIDDEGDRRPATG